MDERDPWKLIAELQSRLVELEAENERLRQRVAELEQAVARQAAPFRRRESKKVAPEQQRRPGRPPGHPGTRRAIPAHIDEELAVPLPECPHCGGPVSGLEPVVQYLEELPVPRVHVTKLTTYRGECPRCGEVRSTHPRQVSTAGGAAEVMLGARAQAVATALKVEQGLTARRACAVLKEVCGLSLSPGGLTQLTARIAGKVQPLYDGLIDRLRGRRAVFADETSWYVGRPGWWLWVFTTPEETVYHVDDSRGSAVVREMLGDDFAGMLVSDCLSSYDPPACAKHKCLAHHLRAIAQARARPDTPDPRYLDQWRRLFAAVHAQWKAREALSADRFAELRQRLEDWCARLLHQPVTQPGDVAVQNRLLKQWRHLLGCLEEPAAEPTNNRAERALRPAVIARKLSCGNKTEAGRTTWQTLTSLAATCRQQRESFIDYLAPRLPLLTGAG